MRLDALVVLGAVTILSGCGTPAPPAPAAPSPSAPAATRPADQPADTVLGPDGWRDVRLGMTAAAARATGHFPSTPAPDTEGCVLWDAAGGSALSGVYVSRRQGVSAIIAAPGAAPGKAVHTPEGMQIGWPRARATAAYPGAIATEGEEASRPVIEVPGHPKAAYRIDLEGDRVSSLALQLTDQECYE
jgi:hypothetical protein